MSESSLKLGCPNDSILVGGQITFSNNNISSMTRLMCKNKDNSNSIVSGPAQGDLSDPIELTSCPNGYDRIDFWKTDEGISGIQFYCDGSNVSSPIGSTSGEYQSIQCMPGERLSGINVQGYFPENNKGNWVNILGAECISGKKQTYVSTVTSFDDSNYRKFAILLVIIISIILLIYVVFSFWWRP